ncbi:MAG: hypothetical protein M3R61_09645 [Chloroflexota bacterium]|nr:hypothetical protein [Chloroflexota bacterium]
MVTAVGNRVRADEIDTYVGLMREAGVQWSREEIFWDKVQREPNGPFQWSGDGSGFYDYEHSIGAQYAAGIRILGLLDYNPAWFKGKNPPPEAWIKDWGDYVYQTVAHFGRGGAIKHWEIWNEPNLSVSGYESGLYRIEDYARVLSVARDAAKAADPEAVIVLGGMAAVWSYPPSPTTYDYFDYRDALGKLGAWSSFDVLAIQLPIGIASAGRGGWMSCRTPMRPSRLCRLFAAAARRWCAIGADARARCCTHRKVHWQ